MNTNLICKQFAKTRGKSRISDLEIDTLENIKTCAINQIFSSRLCRSCSRNMITELIQIYERDYEARSEFRNRAVTCAMFLSCYAFVIWGVTDLKTFLISYIKLLIAAFGVTVSLLLVILNQANSSPFRFNEDNELLKPEDLFLP